MVDMSLILGLSVKIDLKESNVNIDVSHNEYDTRYEKLSVEEFRKYIEETEDLFSDGDREEVSNRLYVTGLNGYCIFNQSSEKDIRKFNDYVFKENKICHPLLDFVLIIDVEDNLI